MQIWPVAAIMLLMGGCASITMGNKQTIQVEIANCGKPTYCTATNKKGSWDFKAPGPVTVDKSDNPLSLRCKDGDNFITRLIAPNKDKMVWGNVLLGGVIGGGWDAHTDAHWELPQVVTIHRETCQ